MKEHYCAGSIGGLLRQGSDQLALIGTTPRLDAELLLAHSLQRPRSYLYAWPERVPEAGEAARFAALIARRLAGEPIAYLTGRREFWSLELEVSPATLIPRPATERLVELALARLATDRPCRVADLGTGSGAIALAIAHERPLSELVATDVCPVALDLARNNARRLKLTNVSFTNGDWCSALPRRDFDLIAANPPYVAASSPYLGRGDVRFEPASALTDGGDGLSALRTIVASAPAYLRPGGWLLVEHGHDQAAAVLALLRKQGFRACADYLDATGLPRVALARWR